MKRLLSIVAVATLFVGCYGEQCKCADEQCKCTDKMCRTEVGAVVDVDGKEQYKITSTLPVEYADDMEWVLRYDKSDVEELRERAKTEDKECDVLFFGSSSIRLWKSLAEDMAPLKVVNRGYGGAMMRDVHYNYSTVLADYEPKAFAFYCDNDLGGFGHDLYPTELFDLYRLLVERLKSDYPDKPIFILSIKFNENRAAKREEHRLFNAIMADYAAHTEGVTFVDVNTPILSADGSVDNGYFEDDKLHVNRKGYAVWASVLRPLLMEALDK